MLVLQRKLGEKLLVGDAIVQVVDFGRNWVRLGIEAPTEIDIWRSELLGECEICHTIESPPTRDGRILCQTCREL